VYKRFDWDNPQI
jgi:5-methylcytosine-specific restriction endonuclease McrBC GTP-binding regulatory subunit McrB